VPGTLRASTGDGQGDLANVCAEGAVQVGYHAFRRHVAELVLQKPTERGRRPTVPPEPSHRSAAPATRTEDKPRAFHHDRMPRKDKIYG
jgi:hypothetical protein